MYMGQLQSVLQFSRLLVSGKNKPEMMSIKSFQGG